MTPENKNSSSEINTKWPHSGNAEGELQERPVREYKETDLSDVAPRHFESLENSETPNDLFAEVPLDTGEQAIVSDKLAARALTAGATETSTFSPKGNETLTQSTERKDTKESSNGLLNFLRKPIGKAAVATATLGVALTAYLGTQSGGNNNAPAPTQTTATAEAKPSGTSAPTAGETQGSVETKEGLIKSLELSVEKYPDEKSLAAAIMSDRWTSWDNMGATQQNQDSYMDPNLNKSVSEFANENADETSDIYPKAIFVENYKSIPGLNTIADAQEKTVSSVTQGAMLTWGDTAQYKRTVKLNGETQLISKSEDGKEMTFTAPWINSSNASENKIGSAKYNPEDVKPLVGTYTISVINVNGKWKISDIKW